eukprot:13142-Heterococcus_DN1.PRE.1
MTTSAAVAIVVISVTSVVIVVLTSATSVLPPDVGAEYTRALPDRARPLSQHKHSACIQYMYTHTQQQRQAMHVSNMSYNKDAVGATA